MLTNDIVLDEEMISNFKKSGFAYSLDFNKIEDGIFEGNVDFIDEKRMKRSWMDDTFPQKVRFGEYGIADSLEQIKKTIIFQWCRDHLTKKFVMVFEKINVSELEEPKNFWEKFGHYFGTQKSNTANVLLFHIYELI